MSVSFIDEMLEDFKPPEKFTITLPILQEADEKKKVRQIGGQSFTFRQFADAEEFDDWRDASMEFARMVIDNANADAGATPKALVHESWKPFLTRKAKIAIGAHMIAYLSVEPKIEQVEALRIAKQTPTVFEHLTGGIERNKFDSPARVAAKLAETKKD